MYVRVFPFGSSLTARSAFGVPVGSHRFGIGAERVFSHLRGAECVRCPRVIGVLFRSRAPTGSAGIEKAVNVPYYRTPKRLFLGKTCHLVRTVLECGDKCIRSPLSN